MYTGLWLSIPNPGQIPMDPSIGIFSIVRFHDRVVFPVPGYREIVLLPADYIRIADWHLPLSNEVQDNSDRFRSVLPWRGIDRPVSVNLKSESGLPYSNHDLWVIPGKDRPHP